MQTNALPDMGMSDTPTGCCPRFDLTGWDGRNLYLENKPFVRGTTRSMLHVPLNTGKVFTGVQRHIEDAGVQDPNDYMTTVSGDFITLVFEGSYCKTGDWINETEFAAKANGHRADRVFMFQTTCSKRARAYGENYVIGIAQIDRSSETEV